MAFAIMTFVVMQGKSSKIILRLWGWIGVLFVSLLSMTKVPDSDLEWIVDHFHQAGQMNYLSFLLLLGNGKEPLYQTFSYAMHYLLADNEKIFIFVLSMISLSLLYISLYIYAEKIKMDRNSYIFCVFVLLFFPFFFGMPVHIVRQTMAMSLLMFVLMNKICRNQFYWPLAICAPFIHSTAMLCVPFLFWGRLKYPYSKKSLILYILVGIIFNNIQRITPFLLPLVGGLYSIAYAIERASYDTEFESRVVGYQLLMSYMIGGSLLFLLWKNHQKLRNHYEINYLSNFIIIITIFIFFASGQAELQARFNLLIFQFLPFVLCVFLKQVKVDGHFLQFVCFLLFIVWLYYVQFVSPFLFKGISSFWYFTILNYYYV